MIGLDVLDKYRNDRGPAWPVFAADFKKFFQQVDKLKKPAILDLNAHKVHVVHSLSEAQALRERMGKVLAWDVETTGLRCTARDELLLTASFSDGETTFAFTVDHPLETNTWAKTFIRDTLLSCERWIAHYSSMELSWAVQHCGLPLSPDQMEDTAAIARIVHDHENLLSLADQSRIWLGTNVKALSDLDTRNLISYPVEDVLRYNGLDSYATKLCFDKNAHITHTSAYRRHIDAIAMTVQMQLYGLPYSLDKSLELKTKWQAKAVAAEQKAHTIYEVKEWQRNTRKEWSITSDQDTADALVRFGHIKLPKTEAGNYVTSEPILLSVAPDNPLVKSVLDYREAAKLVSTYIDPLIEATKRHYDNIPHPCYNVLLTATERLSSEDPNIQNFPRRANVELREQIVAPPGHIMVAFDYGQLEARLIAMASKDQYFCDAVLKGYDIHAEWGPEFVKEYGEFWHMCCEWAGTEEEKKVKKVMRDRIKNKFVFPSFYGANPKSIDGYLELPEGVTAEVHKVFWQRFKGVKQWIEARRAEYDRTGSIRTLTGRTRHSIFSGNEPINTPIQGTAANLASDAMNDCAALARKENDPYLHPRMQIHDDLTFIFPEDHRLETYIDRIFEVMGRCRYDWQILPLLVEAKCGYSWADLDEFATYTGDYVK
jgi:DNA polymerase I-like protein with 3'-5' exonuclease and polymerase domains